MAVYALCAHFGTAVFGNDDPNQAAYNRMIDGFAAGHLYLRRDVPPAFAALPDPYDPRQNGPYRLPPYYLYDLSYYQGRLYAYFGPWPALMLYGPYHLATGGYLSNKAAAGIFCSLGFLAAAGLLLDARRRYAPQMPIALAAILLGAVGLTTAVPTLLTRVDVWEVPIAASTALTLGFLGALWIAWHRPGQEARWLAAASLLLGLAAASRPTTVLFAPLLAAPLLRRRAGNAASGLRQSAFAAAAPLAACLAGLALYNWARFGSPLEFGQKYQLPAGVYGAHIRQFSPSYIWDNLRVYFLHPAPWKRDYPFVNEPAPLSFSDGHSGTEFNFGILPNVPLACFALAALPVLRRRDGLGFLGRLLGMMAVIQTGLLLLLNGTVSRYEAELLLPLVLLAGVAWLGAESQRKRLLPFRAAWIAVAVYSIAFSLAHATDHAIKFRVGGLSWAMEHKDLPAALDAADALVVLEPKNPGFHNERGLILALSGRVPQAISEYRQTVRLDPHAGYAYRNLGRALLFSGDREGAIRQFEESVRLEPGNPAAQAALEEARRMPAP